LGLKSVIFAGQLGTNYKIYTLSALSILKRYLFYLGSSSAETSSSSSMPVADIVNAFFHTSMMKRQKKILISSSSSYKDRRSFRVAADPTEWLGLKIDPWKF
jgi:hypothetical protein